MGTRRNYQRTSNKNDSPLHVLPVAEKLIDYTLDLTDNAKRFPKRVRFSITNKIQGHVMAIYDGRTVSVKEDFYFERRPDIESF